MLKQEWLRCWLRGRFLVSICLMNASLEGSALVPPSLVSIEEPLMGGYTNGGLKIMIFPKFHFGPKSGPKAPFGVKIGGTDAENHDESENKSKTSSTFFKKTNKSNNFQTNKSLIGGKLTGGLKILIFQSFALAQNRPPRHLLG